MQDVEDHLAQGARVGFDPQDVAVHLVVGVMVQVEHLDAALLKGRNVDPLRQALHVGALQRDQGVILSLHDAGVEQVEVRHEVVVLGHILRQVQADRLAGVAQRAAQRQHRTEMVAVQTDMRRQQK